MREITAEDFKNTENKIDLLILIATGMAKWVEKFEFDEVKITEECPF